MNQPFAAAPVSPERIMQFAWGYAPPLALEAAVRLRLFDVLAPGAKGEQELASATKASPRGVRILGNVLVGLGMLTKDATGKYGLTPESETFLVSTSPRYLGGFLKHTSAHLIPRWLQLTEIVRSGQPATAVNQEAEGAEFFGQFVEDLFPLGYAAAGVLADALGVAQTHNCYQVLDLAAGSGVWGIGVAEKSPQVHVRAVDWEGVLPTTRKVVAARGLSQRFTFVAGDLLEADFGSGHQLATLGHIIHSEGEPRSRKLLAKTFTSLAPGGTIAIVEWLVNPDRTGPLAGLIFAMNMLVNTTQGDTYSFEELKSWLTEVGFTKVRLLEAPAPSPLVLADKPA